MPPTLIAPLAALAVLAAAAAVLAVQRWWQRRLLGRSVLGVEPGAHGGDRPDILYFTGESCTVCHVAQRPALVRLRSLLSDVSIRQVDVADDPSTARRYRVMTLPTTVVLDARGRTVAVNVGYASEIALRDQVQAARAPAMDAALA
ncbi:MAG TPA: thioredoxin family protein [Candidatus Deferrimicrobium sp.]|nr:thioredoxin family protein [Candidatus Deferrimicrobium sp.]